MRDNPHLVREDTASYLTMWCVNLEMQEVSWSLSLYSYVHTGSPTRCEAKTKQNYTNKRTVYSLFLYITVEPLIMDTLKSGQPPYNGNTVGPLHIYCPYISTSEEGGNEHNTHPQCVHYLEVRLYWTSHSHTPQYINDVYVSEH